MTSTPGLIPASSALAEASPDSLSEIMSLDPESARFKAALPRMVEALRTQRLRWLASEGSKVRQPKSPGGVASALKKTSGTADDLGF